MTINASQLVQIKPGVLSAAGNAVDLNGVILTDSTSVAVGSVSMFANASDVGKFFGEESAEYLMAQVYFNGFTNSTKTPGRLYFAQHPEQAVSAWLRSASLASVTLTQLKAFSGNLKITVDGTDIEEAVDFSAATSFSNAASIIETALGSAVAVDYDSQLAAFVISSATTGDASTITFASDVMADSLKLTKAAGAVISQGSDALTPAEVMDSIVSKTLNWATFTTTTEPDTAGKLAFSAWVNAQGERFLYVGYDTDVNAKVSGSTTTWGAQVKAADYDGSALVYGTNLHAAFVMGTAAAIDFTRLNGRITFAFRNQSGLEPYVDNQTDAIALIDNGYNYYGAYATANQDFTIFYPGSISGQWKWLDSYVNQIWLNANLQLSMVNLLVNTNSIPYEDDGYAMVEAACLDPINASINFGAIRVGVTLSAEQKEQIKNAIGLDVASSITSKGYYLDIKDAAPSVRAGRASPPMTLYYADGGSIQQLTLASIEVQ